MSILSIKNLRLATQAGVPLVKDVSFEVGAGEIVVLLGQSGSGKSLTARAVFDLLPAGVVRTGGKISILDKDFCPEMRGRDISMIAQAPASCFDPVYTLREQMVDIFKSHKMVSLCSDEELSRIIAQVIPVDPREILGAYSFQLSGGMLQRLMVAITLALDAPLIIADEPTSDLDIPVQAEIIRLLMNIERKNKGIVMITHDLGVAERMADRVVVLLGGLVVDSFASSSLHSLERHPYTKSLIEANNKLYENSWILNGKSLWGATA